MREENVGLAEQARIVNCELPSSMRSLGSYSTLLECYMKAQRDIAGSLEIPVMFYSVSLGNAIIICIYHIDDFEMLRFKFSRLV